ncbi:PspA-associated protein PspAA [Streptacidiphilus sp. PAMC 29251]
MITARILGEGQYRIPDGDLEELEKLDAVLQEAVARGSQAAFAPALQALLDAVRRLGTASPRADLSPSALILPDEDMTLSQVQALLTDADLIHEGLIRGRG